MYKDLEHPQIGWALRTGYPSWMQEKEEEAYDEDGLYEERRERELLEEEV